MSDQENQDFDRWLQSAAMRSNRRPPRRLKLFTYAPIVLIAAAAGTIAVSVAAGESQRREAVTAAAATPIEGVQPYEIPDGNNNGSPAADANDHARAATVCVPHDAPVEEGIGLHALGHGAVWLTYNPNLPEKEVSDLQDLARDYPYVIASPQQGQFEPVTIRAWNVRMDVNYAEDNRIEPFIIKYTQGTQVPEPSAPCGN